MSSSIFYLNSLMDKSIARENINRITTELYEYLVCTNKGSDQLIYKTMQKAIRDENFDDELYIGEYIHTVYEQTWSLKNRLLNDYCYVLPVQHILDSMSTFH